MTLKEQTSAVCRVMMGAARKTLLFGLGVTAVIVENITDVVENAGPYSEQLVERGEKTSQEINEALEVRRREIRHRAKANGHVKEA